MTDTSINQSVDLHPAWPSRPAIMAAIGGASALAGQQILDGGQTPPSLTAIAIAIAIGTTAISFGFVAERLRLAWAVAFAIGTGSVAGLIVHWQGIPGGSPDFWDWRVASLFLAIAIASPLFQTARAEGRWRFPYSELHGHAWTNVVVWCAAWIFVGIVFALSWLLASLFNLIQIDFLERLLVKEWFVAPLFGTAFGGAVGLLRERDQVVRLLQNVVTAVLGVLAPVLGAGLIIFLAALPFMGLGALWDATRSTTPILLSCIVGALILANAVIGNGAEGESRNTVLRLGAAALAVVMLPLAIIAAIATGLRIGQYGFTPDRLWALTFVILATAYGLAYIAALVRGRGGWAAYAQSANITLGFAVAALALFLSTPILNFKALSTDDQVARLTSGAVSPEKFDWAALGFDFGGPGKAALQRLSRSGNTKIAERAKRALVADSRWDAPDGKSAGESPADFAKRLRVQPQPVPLPAGLIASFAVSTDTEQTAKRPAVLWYRPGEKSAILVVGALGESSPDIQISRQNAKGEWEHDTSGGMPPISSESDANRKLAASLAKDGLEIRTVPRRQVFIGDVAVGEPFE